MIFYPNGNLLIRTGWFGTFLGTIIPTDELIFLGTIIPTDELIFFRGIETTNQRNLTIRNVCVMFVAIGIVNFADRMEI